MVHAFTTDVPIDADRYRAIVEGFGPEPLEGLLVHLCVRLPEGGLRYIDVWETRAQCEAAFRDRIHPAVDRAFGGARPPEPSGAPLDVVEVRFADAVHAG